MSNYTDLWTFVHYVLQRRYVDGLNPSDNSILFLMMNNMPWSGCTSLFIHSLAEGHGPSIEFNASILQLNDYSRE